MLSRDEADFEKLTAPFRRELTAHCYRLLGSSSDAEDMVQETLLRAWKNFATFEHRAAVRSWLYRIATNACLDALDQRKVRKLREGPPGDANAPLPPPTPADEWVEPIPDSWVASTDSHPEARYSQRESIALAFIAALQLLPPRQRAVLVLRDVLGLESSEVAQMLELSVAAVNSALQRARATLSKETPPATSRPSDETQRSLLDRYLKAWSSADANALLALLKEDAALAMPPLPLWLRGAEVVARFLVEMAKRRPLQAMPACANGQPALLMLEGGKPVAIQLLRVDGGRISAIDSFLDPAIAARFSA